MNGTDWYDVEPPKIGIWWWAVEHFGHPAFYLRALMPGDFAPGRAPLDRHALALSGAQSSGPVQCGTCDEVPEPQNLEVIERATGGRSFLEPFRSRRRPWPKVTDPATCWECSDRSAPADHQVEIPGPGRVRVCARCAAHMARERR